MCVCVDPLLLGRGTRTEAESSLISIISLIGPPDLIGLTDVTIWVVESKRIREKAETNLLLPSLPSKLSF